MLGQVVSPDGGIGIILALVALLVVKELSVPANGRLPPAFYQALNIGIALLMLVFLFNMGLKITAYLRLTV